MWDAKWCVSSMGANMLANRSGAVCIPGAGTETLGVVHCAFGTCVLGLSGQLPRPVHLGVAGENMADEGLGICVMCCGGVAGYLPRPVDVPVRLVVVGGMGPNISSNKGSGGGAPAPAASLGAPCARCPTSAWGPRATCDNEGCAAFEAPAGTTTSFVAYRGIRCISALGWLFTARPAMSPFT